MSDRQSAVGALREQTEAARTLLAICRDILGDDDVLQRDMVDGGTGLNDALRHGISRIVEIRALLTGIADTMRVLKSRADAFEQQEERIRAAMMTAMEVGRLPKLETSLGTAYPANTVPSVIIINAEEIPARYLRYPPPEPKKKEIKAAINRGEEVPGAELSNGGRTLVLKLT